MNLNEPDILFLDLEMPKIIGFELLVALKILLFRLFLLPLTAIMQLKHLNKMQ